MELSEEAQSRRPRRANAGNLLQQLLEQGLNDEEEQLLQQLDDADSSDSSFTASSGDSDDDDVFDSDFSDEEEEGVLEGEVVETDASARRAERQERHAADKRNMQRMRNFAHRGRVARRGRARASSSAPPKKKKERTGGEGGQRGGHSAEDTDKDEEAEEDDERVDLRQAVRKRKPPTIPPAQRMAEALARAQAVRQQQQQQQQQQSAADDPQQRLGRPVEGVGVGDTINLLTSLQQRGVGRGRRQRAAAAAVDGRRTHTDTGRRIGEAEGADVPHGLFAATGSSTMATAAPPAAPFCDVNRRMWLYAGSRVVPRQGQRVRYSSNAQLLKAYGTPVVYSFSVDLPAVFAQPPGTTPKHR